MSNTRKIAYNTAVQIIARVIVTGISLVALAYGARYLGVIGMGKYNLIFAYLGLFGVILDFGFFLLQVREITKTPEREGYIIGNVLGLKLSLSALVFGLAYLIAVLVYHDPIITTGILIGAISQASLSYAQIPISLFQARLKMDRVAITNVITRAIYFGLILLAIRQDWGVLGLVWVAVSVNVLALLIQSALIWPERPLQPQWDLKYWWSFTREAAPLGVAVVLATIYFRIDSIILSLMKGTYEVGIYTTPYKIIEVVLTVPTIFMSSVFPVLTQALGEGLAATQRVFRKAFDFSSLVGIPIVAGTMAISTPLMVAIAGPEFHASGAVLQIVIWTTLASFFGAVLTYTIIAAGQQLRLTLPYVLATIFNIVANLLLIPRYSYIAASYITVATEAFVMLYAAWLVYRFMKLTPNWTVTLKSLLSSAVMLGAIYLVGPSNLWLSVVVAVAVYAVMVVLTKAVSRDVLRELKLVR